MSYAFFPPSARPAAISKLTPPSIGQTAPNGSPQGGGPKPPGGSGGCAENNNGMANNKAITNTLRSNLIAFTFKLTYKSISF
jgi:hypothetical protein